MKVGEKPENVKVFQYFLEDTNALESSISSEGRRSRSAERMKRLSQGHTEAVVDQHDGPRRTLNHAPQRKSLKSSANGITSNNVPA